MHGVAADDASRAYLVARLDLLRRQVRAAVELRRSTDLEPDDPFRGLYISDEQAVQLLEPRPELAVATSGFADLESSLEQLARGAHSSATSIRLLEVAEAFELSALDVALFLVAFGPDLDPRLERAYGYLHDDVTRRRASIGLALELCGVDSLDASARHRFAPTGPLVANGLIQVDDLERPFLTRSLSVPDPVGEYLLGGGGADPAVTPFLTDAVVDHALDTADLERALRAGVRLVYVRDRVGAAALSFVTTALHRCGSGAMALDLSRLDPSEPVAALASAARGQARLTGRTLVAGPVEAIADRGTGAVRGVVGGDATVVMIGTRNWDPIWSEDPPLVLDAPELSPPDGSFEGLSLRLTPEQAQRAHLAAELLAVADGTTPTVEHLAVGARAQNAGGLERLALRIPPRAGWDDLVVPGEVMGQLRDLASRVRHRGTVLGEWGLDRGAAKGTGVTALFAGSSGTGKTLAAEVMASELQLDLYVIDLATVVDKYIGETEKNLDRIFGEADRVNGVLLFDEADAIFGKRSEVQDARDRYANVEVAYLLQRMERFDGVAILTTNLRANIDEAFLRRLDVLVDFPSPDEDLRLRLWERHLPRSLPRDDTVDLGFLASSFDLAGGNIRNIALSGAFLAAANGGQVTMEHLVQATAHEYRKLGRLCVPSEFGPWHRVVQRG